MKKTLKHAFTLVEILGATALIATLATISVISVKDSVAAGQKASVQRELQGLNNSLSNFKSAGGVIPAEASAVDALNALSAGVGIAGTGSTYTPMTSAPALNATIAGIDYGLDYNPETGFSYVPEGSEVGAVLGQSGEIVGVGANGTTYPFDITDPTEVLQALQEFGAMSPSDPNYPVYLEAINAAKDLGNLSSELVAQIDSSMQSSGLVKVNNNWTAPAFDILDQYAAMAATQGLSSIRNDAEAYGKTIATLKSFFDNVASNNDAYYWDGLAAEDIKNKLDEEFYNIAVPNKSDAMKQIDWSQLGPINFNLCGRDLSGLQITGSQITSDLEESNVSGLNLAGYDFSGRSLRFCNLSGATGFAGTQLSSASNIEYANLRNTNLAGFSAVGKNVCGVDFTGATNFAGSQLNGAVDFSSANLAGVNMSGFSAAGKRLVNVNFNGATNLTFDMLKDAAWEVGSWGVDGTDFRGTPITALDFLNEGWNYYQVSGGIFDTEIPPWEERWSP